MKLPTFSDFFHTLQEPLPRFLSCAERAPLTLLLQSQEATVP
jgi:hypothetical protein